MPDIQVALEDPNEYLNYDTVTVLTREPGHDGSSVWDGRENKKQTNTLSERREREREMKTNKNDLCRNIVEEKNNTSRTEVEKSKVPP